MDFNATLLREKFEIFGKKKGQIVGPPVIALSNRIVLPLRDARGHIVEKLIVRAQNMHSCLRMAAAIIEEYQARGPLLNRTRTVEWENAWRNTIDVHERRYNNEARWVAVYHKGKIIYESGKRHNFLDIIERCDNKNTKQYDNALRLAEAAFLQLGKNVVIKYDSNIAAIIRTEHNIARCGVIMRSAEKTTTFNFTAEEQTNRPISVPKCLNIVAAFLEGIQLCFMIGMVNEKVRLCTVPNDSLENLEAKSAHRRLMKLIPEIKLFDETRQVFYRPEKPDLTALLIAAENLAHRQFLKDRNSPPKN